MLECFLINALPKAIIEEMRGFVFLADVESTFFRHLKKIGDAVGIVGDLSLPHTFYLLEWDFFDLIQKCIKHVDADFVRYYFPIDLRACP
jgi:hypothetical protein